MGISQEISYRLERLILEGELLPKQKIPSERQLATRLGVSRSVIREALHELQGRGFIETHHGKGSFVSPMIGGVENLSEPNPLMHLFEGHPRTLYDLLEVREQLEGQAARLAAERATSLDHHRITEAYRALEETDPLSNARADHDFHHAIVDASHNPVLVHMLNSIENMMLMTVQASVANLNPRTEMRKKIALQHRQLYEAVISGKPIIAQRVAMAHVRFVSRAMQDLENQGKTVVRSAVKADGESIL